MVIITFCRDTPCLLQVPRFRFQIPIYISCQWALGTKYTDKDEPYTADPSNFPIKRRPVSYSLIQYAIIVVAKKMIGAGTR